VVLSANMALLALPLLSKGARTASIISTLFSIGSIVVGLHHVRRFRDKREMNARQVGTYIRNAARLTGSLWPLSFFLSLPISFLAWSIIAFACSVSIYAFQMIGAFLSVVPLAFLLVIVILTLLFFWIFVFA